MRHFSIFKHEIQGLFFYFSIFRLFLWRWNLSCGKIILTRAGPHLETLLPGLELEKNKWLCLKSDCKVIGEEKNIGWRKMFRQVSLTTLIRPLLFLAILFVAMVLYLSERQNAIDRQVRWNEGFLGRLHFHPGLLYAGEQSARWYS